MVLSCAYIFFVAHMCHGQNQGKLFLNLVDGHQSMFMIIYLPREKKKDPIHHGGITYILNLSMALIFPKTAQNCLEVQFQFFLWKHIFKYIYIYMIGGFEHFLFFHILGKIFRTS